VNLGARMEHATHADRRQRHGHGRALSE
jgi:hypothetical protein